MITEKIKINDPGSDAILYSYILDEQPRLMQKQDRPAIIICPGGGYLLTARKEGEPVAVKFASMGYHTFVLRYTTFLKARLGEDGSMPPVNENGAFPRQLLDLGAAMIVIRERASEWHLDVNQIFLMGFSAGAHLSACMGTMWNQDLLMNHFQVASDFFKTKGMILGYPLLDMDTMIVDNPQFVQDEMPIQLEYCLRCLCHTSFPTQEQRNAVSPCKMVSKDTPPVFIWQAWNDKTTVVRNSLMFAERLEEVGVSCELHLFRDGVHGAALCDEVCASEPEHYNEACAKWVSLANLWLKGMCDETEKDM